MTTAANDPDLDGLENPDQAVFACNSAVAALHVDGAAFSLVNAHRLVLVGSTEEPYARLERTQQFYNAGSATHALSRRKPIAVGDLESYEQRWPEFCFLARQIGVLSVLSLPIGSASGIDGVLTCYGRTRRNWSSADLVAAGRISSCVSRQMTAAGLLFRHASETGAAPIEVAQRLIRRAEPHREF